MSEMECGMIEVGNCAERKIASMSNNEVTWHEIIEVAHELGEQLLQSQRLWEFQQSKRAMQSDTHVQQQIHHFQKAKQTWEDTDRYGMFHPSYQEALNRVQNEQEKLGSFDLVESFQKSEKALDDLLYRISETIARSVSEQIKVPGNQIQQSSGCGGNCNGGCA